MIIAEWSLSFETRALPEGRLRAIANEMFQGQIGRDYWKKARESRLSTSASRRERRFHEILDEEYRRAQPTAVTERTLPAAATEGKSTAKQRLLWMSAGAAAMVIYRTLRRGTRRR